MIAEIFMDGQVLFDLAQLLKYKMHGFDEYDPTKLLAKKVKDPEVRQLIEHCINLEPKARWTPQKYLDFYKGKIFPLYFDDLYDVFKRFLNVTFSEADHKIKYLQKKYVDILRMVSSTKTNNQQDFNFTNSVPELFRKEKRSHAALTPSHAALASTQSLLSATSPNSQPQSNMDLHIPRLEIIMRQQRLQQQAMDDYTYVISLCDI